MQNCVKCNKIRTDWCNPIGAATPLVPNQTPRPQPSKQLLNACPIPPVHVIVRLLAGCQSAILSSNEWHNDMSPCILGGPQTKGDKIRSGCLTPAFSGAHKRADVLRNPCILGGPQQRRQNQKSKPTLGVTMMPLVSQSMGL